MFPLHIPPIFRYPDALLFWAVLAWVYAPEFRLVGRAVPKSFSPQDAGTFWLLVVAAQISGTAALAASFLPMFLLPSQRIALYVGTGFVLAGGLLRRWSFRLLGQHFSGEISVTADQPIIEHGPYRLIRHPSYTGVILVYLGLGVALGSWLSTIVLVVERCTTLAIRVRAEERALLAVLGDRYRQYMSRTWRFVPFLL